MNFLLEIISIQFYIHSKPKKISNIPESNHISSNKRENLSYINSNIAIYLGSLATKYSLFLTFISSFISYQRDINS